MLSHHELCFGCGQTNLFGLLLELERVEDGFATGRCFIKQDHQGADRGIAHEGVIAAALSEAMALALGSEARIRRLEVELTGRVDVGSFVTVEARALSGTARASATADGDEVAVATGIYALS